MLRNAPGWIRRTLIVLAVLAAVAIGLGASARHFFLSDAQLQARIAGEFERRTGVGLAIGALHWRLWPVPSVVLERLATRQPKPLTAERIALQTPWGSVLRREVNISHVEIERAVLQRESIHALGDGYRSLRKAPKAKVAGGAWQLAEVPIGEVRFRGLTWVNQRGVALGYTGRVRFDPDWRPARADVALDEAPQPATLALRRQGTEDRWKLDIAVAGGSWNGETQLATGDDGQLRLSGRFTPNNIDVALFTQSFKRHAVVTGRATGTTDIDSAGDNVGALVSHLHTRTRFAMHPARIEGFDLTRVLDKQGMKSGHTELNNFTGTLETQNGQHGGIRFTYSDLRATSGLFTATGNISVLNRRLDGEAAIDLVDGVVGLPLKIDGTLEKPVVLLTGGAVTGAAVGSAVLPGVGTAIGARIGQQMERLFGDKKKAPSGKAPAKAGAPRR